MSPINKHCYSKCCQCCEGDSARGHILDETDFMVKIRMNEVTDLFHRSIQAFN